MVNCGRRWGKSTLGEDLAVDPALHGYPVGWFSPDYKSLLEVWRDLCRVLAPVTSRKSEQEKRLELITGGVIEFWALDADPECSRGRKYARVIIDEAAKVRHLMRAWTEAILANLADYHAILGDAWFLSTPKGRNNYWELFQRGLDPAQPDWCCWQMPTSDNPYITPEAIAVMRHEMGPRIASQEVDAQFLEVGGRFFDEWESAKGDEETAHEIWSFPIPRWWETWGGFDWGKANPFAFGLFVADANGDVILIDEEYDPGLSNFEQAQRILRCLERNQRSPSAVPIFADPSIFPPRDPKERVGRYTAEDFWAQGLHFQRANNDRINGWTRVKEFMRRRRETEEGKTVAGLRVFKDRCRNVVRTLPLMEPDEKKPEDMNTLLEDHASDMLRYGIARPPQSVEPKQMSPEEQYLAERRRRAKAAGTGGAAQEWQV